MGRGSVQSLRSRVLRAPLPELRARPRLGFVSAPLRVGRRNPHCPRVCRQKKTTSRQPQLAREVRRPHPPEGGRHRDSRGDFVHGQPNARVGMLGLMMTTNDAIVRSSVWLGAGRAACTHQSVEIVNGTSPGRIRGVAPSQWCTHTSVSNPAPRQHHPSSRSWPVVLLSRRARVKQNAN